MLRILDRYVLRELMDRLHGELDDPARGPHVCGGTLLSREQYLYDIERWGYVDARLLPPAARAVDRARHRIDSGDIQVDIPPLARASLYAHLAERLFAGARPDDPLFDSRAGGALALYGYRRTIETVAREYGLEAIPVREEHYDFVAPRRRLERPAVRDFDFLIRPGERRIYRRSSEKPDTQGKREEKQRITRHASSSKAEG